jgi:hypothetical protein
MSISQNTLNILTKYEATPLPLSYFFDGDKNGKANHKQNLGGDEKSYFFKFPCGAILIYNDDKNGSNIYTNHAQASKIVAELIA